MSSSLLHLAAVDLFKQLPADDLARLEQRLEPLFVQRGSELVHQGDAADALYVVISGRFSVETADRPEPIAEISSGAPIGEIAFFAGGARTATVRAIRDSVVVKLTRSDFDDISARSPAVWQAITAKLAERLAVETRKTAALQNKSRPSPAPRTLALVRAGDRPIPAQFLTAFEAAARSRARTLVITSATFSEHAGNGPIETLDATQALNELEGRYDTVVFIADAELTAWSEKAIRQADEVLLVGTQGDSPVGTSVSANPVEAFLLSLERKPRCRLVIVHNRAGVVQGTRHWLGVRAPEMHHHVALGSTADIERLWRFIKGEALGYVACGGGAYCAAHIGIYKAFREKNIEFDCVGGTSGGAAMAAAFAQNIDAAEINARVHRMFIDGKALSRYTIPRYSLLDHTHFDKHLAAEYGEVRIEDMWKPFFAVSMDLSDYAVEIHRSGPVWEAIRASASIPALLPPFYTRDGRMLVDGSVVSNVPIEIMHGLKRGPNIVVSFKPPAGERFSVDYKSLPARQELFMRTINPFARGGLPNAPSAATVLIRSLMSNHSHFERRLESDDWLIVPPTDADMGALDWRRHDEVVESAYRHALAEIAARKS